MKFKFNWEIVANNIFFTHIWHKNKILAFQIEASRDFTSDKYVADLIHSWNGIRLAGYFKDKEEIETKVARILSEFDIVRLEW